MNMTVHAAMAASMTDSRCWPNGTLGGKPVRRAGQPQQPARFLAVRDMQDSALDPGCLRQFGENARRWPATTERAPVATALRDGGVQLNLLLLRLRWPGQRDSREQQPLARSGISWTTGWWPTAAAARGRLNSAAPQAICSARPSGSPTRSTRAGSAYRPVVWLAGSNRKRHGCVLCIEGAMVAAAISSTTISCGWSPEESCGAAVPGSPTAGSRCRERLCAVPPWGGSAPEVASRRLISGSSFVCLRQPLPA